MPIAIAGNHCQGTLFRDGSHLWTWQLEARIDEIAHTSPSFYFGRFDIRFADESRLKAGEDFVVIELNGITSESTNVYDPAFSLWKAHHVLRKQWAILFEIAHTNIRRGVKPSQSRALLQCLLDQCRGVQPPDLSD